MERLTCNECKRVYAGEADIKLAKGMKEEYEKMCKQDKFIPKGIAPCPNMMCEGELILTTK